MLAGKSVDVDAARPSFAPLANLEEVEELVRKLELEEELRAQRKQQKKAGGQRMDRCVGLPWRNRLQHCKRPDFLFGAWRLITFSGKEVEARCLENWIVGCFE